MNEEVIKIDKYKIFCHNTEEARELGGEIFSEHVYFADLDKDNPVIIDAGAHIGLATLYFKKLFPQARVIAVEPHPVSAELWRKNMEINGIEGVELIEAALSRRSGGTDLFFDASEDRWYSTASVYRGAWNGKQLSSLIRVNTIRLAELLDRPVDLLKMDIEGLEEKVLRDSKDKLNRVKKLIIEYHPLGGKKPEKLATWLTQQGFRILSDARGTADLNLEKLVLMEAEK